ncbi:AAA family ATPase [Amycolatopsis sp. NPDC051903]|uniref:helix-turn-helix transcriptional regulator n=1 Tax=Amycolatopsis sp. NPDC051903 TaxID=3363936 RepID=UPI003798E13F
MLYGRGAECAEIRGLLAAARDSRSGALVLRGEPGAGKSALLNYAAAEAGGMRLLRGAGVETEVRLPFAALHQLLHPVLDRAGLLPDPQAAALRGAFGLAPGRGGDPFLIAVAALSLLGEVAGERGLLCLVDDAQWLDHGSAEVLAFVARRVQEDGVALLFAAREGESREFRAPGLPELAVGGLAVEAAGALLDEAAPGLAPGVCAALVAGTAGNPLALLEIPASLSADQLAGRAPLPVPLDAGRDVERLFLARVRALGEAAQRFLLVASAESGGDLLAVLRAAGADGAGLDEAERAGLVGVLGDRLEFRHPLVRSAVYHGATFLARRSAHLALGAVFDAAHDTDRRAWHLAAAALEPSAELAKALEESAARARARGGAAAAANALERAAQLSTADADRAALLVAAAEDAWHAGQNGRVAALLDAAERLDTPRSVRGRGWFLRGMVELRSGDPAAACRLLLRSAAETPEDGPATLVHAGEAAALLGDPVLAAEVERCAGEGDQSRLVAGWASLARDDWHAGARLLGSVVDAAGADDDPVRQLWTGRAALYLGDVDTARTAYTRAVARARAGGEVGALPMVLDRLAFTDVLAGRPAEATANATEGLRLAGDLGLDVGLALVSLALAAAWTGDGPACRRAADRAHRVAADRGLTVVAAGADWALGLLALGAGQPAEAATRLWSLAPGGPGDHALIRLWATPDLVEAAVRAGEPGAVRESVTALAHWARGSPQPGPTAALSRCEGLLSGEVDRFRAAVRLDPQGRQPLERARTQLLLGESLRRERRRSESRAHLRAALETFERAGAAAWAERAATELRASGESAHKRDEAQWARLTPQELQIARFAGEGASNPDIAAKMFLSRRTVEYHLHKVFTKLGVTSRTELARLDLDG